MKMTIAKEELLKANPHVCGVGIAEYTALVENPAEAQKLASKLKVRHFELDGVFYGRTHQGWNSAR